MENSDSKTPAQDGAPQNASSSQGAKPVRKKRNSGYGYGYNYSAYGNYGGYGGYYGGYGAYGGYGGYGYGTNPSASGEGAEAPNRTLRDYFMILRERLWYIIVTFIVIFSGIALYTLRITPLYTSASSVLIFREAAAPIDGPGSSDRTRNDKVLSVEDFNTQVKILESNEVIRAVRSRLKEDDLRKLMAPYKDMFTFGPRKTEEEILQMNRRVIPERMSLMIRVTYTHPNAEMAARIADLFVNEYITYTRMTRVQTLLDSIEELRTKVAQQETKVKELDRRLVEYREKNGAISLDQMDDVDRRELQEMNTILTTDKRTYDAAAIQWSLLQEYKRDGRDLCTLPFIADLPIISKLVSDRSQYQVSVSTLEKRYKEKHPRMIEARKALDQVDKELAAALDSAYEKVRSTYLTMKNNYEMSQQRLNKKREEILQLGRKAIVYKALERERKVAEGMHAEFIAAMNVRLAQVSLITDNAKVIDKAGISPLPSSPNYILNFVGGFILALFGGIAMAFVVAFLDDRAKSAYDVETVIGLPLLGVIPRIKRLSSAEKAQVAASNADRASTEAFRTLYSTLKINNVSKDAKVILATSTTPSEGKSFVISNLAFTCALNGEKCIIIDADLRLPALAKVLGISASKGLVSYIEEGDSLDDVIIKDYFQNLDVLVCERRAKNPSQMLNSEEFVSMIESFREKYDKVFIDSPPIGAVSDAISLLPEVDGVLYVIKFNTAKRKVVRRCVRRMMESNVPVLGAVMNMVNTGAVAGYSINYYDKNYQNYYMTPPEIENQQQEGRRQPPEVSRSGGEEKNS